MELSRRYAGTVSGWAVAIAYPLLQLSVYWLVFGLGLKLPAGAHTSFGAVLAAGMVPWFFFNDALFSITHSITGNSALVKKMPLPVLLLPTASLGAALITHTIVLTCVLIILVLSGIVPSLALASLIYFCGCLCVLLLALGCLLALANAAIRDVGQLLNPALWICFWLTPIVWPATIIPANWQWLIHLNPLAYVVAGYRAALLGFGAAPPDATSALWFWAEIGVLGAATWLLFRRLRPELADLL